MAMFSCLIWHLAAAPQVQPSTRLHRPQGSLVIPLGGFAMLAMWGVGTALSWVPGAISLPATPPHSHHAPITLLTHPTYSHAARDQTCPQLPMKAMAQLTCYVAAPARLVRVEAVLAVSQLRVLHLTHTIVAGADWPMRGSHHC